ncbi:DUF1642 domain-containing protein [Aerococcaceae bacterium NML130460]|nr:DUF1642 domain-containing protein [Aerococcaceae bacterium NML130460]
MDKQELIEKVDEPKKVVLPKDMAEWFEEHKGYGLYTLIENFQRLFLGYHKMAEDFVRKHSKSHRIDDAYKEIARAYLDGYEIEPEKLYTVVLPGSENISDDRRYYLSRTSKDNIELVYRNFSAGGDMELTEAEIKSLDERYMAFAQEVAE